MLFKVFEGGGLIGTPTTAHSPFTELAENGNCNLIGWC